METLAPLLVWTLTAYLAVGLLFAIPFLARGITRIDDAAVGTGWGFRLMILPGVITFWPLLALRWAKAAG